ncbi:MAG TPA: hypothetical protein PLF31_00185 [Candidatus Paceibacterota bacterium]|nr:hypothetical protein [Candidatus Paceibacterota bacterium]
MQDIIPPDKRSIRNVSLPGRPPQRTSAPAERLSYPGSEGIVFDEVHQLDKPKEEQPIQAPKTDYSRPHVYQAPMYAQTPVPVKTAAPAQSTSGYEYEGYEKKSSSIRSSIRFGITVLAILAFAGAGFYAYAQYYGGATVTVRPKQEQITISGTYEFKEGEFRHDESVEQVQFTVLAGEPEQVTERAEGTITIYNEFGTGSQTFVKNTRFQTPSGKIYRIQNAVVVPGYKMVAGKKVAGSVDAVVTADAPGEAYNLATGDFKIPGLEGDERYAGFYAKVKTPIQGGFSGTRNKVSQADVAEAYATAIESRKTIMAASAGGDGFVAIPSLVFTEQDSPKQTEVSTAGEATFVGTLRTHSIRLSEEVLSDYLLALSKKKQTNDERIMVSSVDTVTAEPEKKTQSPWTDTVQRLRISGSVPVTWYFNEQKLTEDLAGKSKDNLSGVLAAYTGIEEAEAIVRPFWKTSFPTEPGEIEVVKAE